jgi:hypothetical protein
MDSPIVNNMLVGKRKGLGNIDIAKNIGLFLCKGNWRTEHFEVEASSYSIWD